MTGSRSNVLVLAHDLADAVLGPRVGSLDLRVTDDAPSAPFRLLDDFDGSIRRSGRMLIETNRNLVLYSDKGLPVSQGANGSGNLVADLAAGPVADAVQTLSPLRKLLGVGEGQIERRRLSLTDDEGKTQARAELTTLHPEGEGAAVTFAALHGLRGYDDALDALRAHLGAFAAAGHESVSGLPDLLFPGTATYTAKPEIVIAAGDSAFSTANAIIAAYLAVARSNEDGIAADHDTEFLHDYRVALRKIRSVISLFAGVYSDKQTAALKKTFSDLMAPTGRLRDLDVYLLGRDAYFAMLPETLHDGLALMFGMFAHERRKEQAKLTRRLRSAAYKKTLVDVERLFAAKPGPAKGPEADREVMPYACKLIWKRYRKVCTIAATITADTPDEQVHRLRIICKKLRYLIEFFAPLFPASEIKVLLKPLKGLQENLGLFNDYSVQQVALQGFLDAHEPIGQKQDLILAQSIGALIAVLHARQKEERIQVMSNFAQFDSPHIRSTFRALFHGGGAPR